MFLITRVVEKHCQGILWVTKGLMQPCHEELPTLMLLLWGFRTTQYKDSLKMQEEGLFSVIPTQPPSCTKWRKKPNS
jgi:nitrogen fixation-related uncharacterized protein